MLHLLYSDFYKVLYDGDLSVDEPFGKMRHQGIILGRMVLNVQIQRQCGGSDELVKDFGADAVDVFAFMGPYELGGPWNPRGLSG